MCNNDGFSRGLKFPAWVKGNKAWRKPNTEPKQIASKRRRGTSQSRWYCKRQDLPELWGITVACVSKTNTPPRRKAYLCYNQGFSRGQELSDWLGSQSFRRINRLKHVLCLIWALWHTVVVLWSDSLVEVVGLPPCRVWVENYETKSGECCHVVK